jgi:hypothetical protein
MTFPWKLTSRREDEADVAGGPWCCGRVYEALLLNVDVLNRICCLNEFCIKSFESPPGIKHKIIQASSSVHGNVHLYKDSADIVFHRNLIVTHYSFFSRTC